jgi:uncharacterized membrane protein (DUF4010 family)
MIGSELGAAARLAVAGLIGLMVGLEREWSGYSSGGDERFAGIRTFLLLGLLGGSAGLLAVQGFGVLGAAFALGGTGLTVAAYVIAVRRANARVDGTTETAALVVLALAAIAGMGWPMLAAGAGSVMVLVLSEKTRLHALVHRIGQEELHAALQFAVLAVVVWPLLPAGPFLGALAIRPQTLWSVVLIFSGLNFAGYIARRAAGSRSGNVITGALGGVISSTAVTFAFARLSRSNEAQGVSLARGVIAACTVLVIRVLVISAFLNPAVALGLAPLVALPFVVGLLMTLFAWRREAGHPPAEAANAADQKNPLRLINALQMAVAFQVSITAIAFVRAKLGTTGVYATAAVLGLTDMDALTVSMSSPSSLIPATIAARGLAIGILANTFLKATVAVVIGRPAFWRAAATGLLCLAAASVAGLFL